VVLKESPVIGRHTATANRNGLSFKRLELQSKLLRKWVQGLGAEQGAAAFMKDASAAKNHSTSPPLEDKGEEDEEDEDEDADADEDEDSDEEDKEVHGGAAGEQGAGDGKIYLRMYLSICSWSLPCQRCLCWSLPCVCVCVFITAVPMKKLFAWGDWCECVCLLIIIFCSESLLLDRCCCSTGVRAGALGSESTL
jgi:hypothetical protein